MTDYDAESNTCEASVRKYLVVSGAFYHGPESMEAPSSHLAHLVSLF